MTNDKINHKKVDKFELIIPYLVLIGSISLLQYHAIIFWQSQIGQLGWAWPIMIEGVALWLWYQTKTSLRFIALIASCLALFGPVNEVSKPILDTVIYADHTAAAQVKNIQNIENQISLLESNIATYRDNSTQRTGWLEPIQDGERKLETLRSELAIANAVKPADVGNWRNHWIIIMQALALILFQFSAIISITTISKNNKKERNAHMGNNHSMTMPQNNKKENKLQAIDKHRETQGNRLGKTEPTQETNGNNISRMETPIATKVPMENEGFPVEEAFQEQSGQVGKFSFEEVLSIENHLAQTIKRIGGSRSAFGKKHNLSARDLSFLRNHETRAKTGERTISEEALSKIVDVLASIDK